jgi:hypothetical protein
VGSVEGDSGTLDYVNVWGFPDPIVSTSQGLCPLEAGVYRVPQFERLRLVSMTVNLQDHERGATC